MNPSAGDIVLLPRQRAIFLPYEERWTWCPSQTLILVLREKSPFEMDGLYMAYSPNHGVIGIRLVDRHHPLLGG